MNDGIPATVLPWSERRFPPLKAEKYTPRGIWLISCFSSDVRKSSKAERRKKNRDEEMTFTIPETSGEKQRLEGTIQRWGGGGAEP